MTNHVRKDAALEGDFTSSDFQAMSFSVIPLVSVTCEEQELGTMTLKTVVRSDGIRQLAGMHSADRTERLDFEELNHTTIKPVGLYGNMQNMCDWLAGENIIDTSIFPTDPGLYCVSSAECDVRFIVLVPTKDALTRMSRKNMTCNLMRYLLELCNEILVFYDSEDVVMFKANPYVDDTKNDTLRTQLKSEEWEEESVELGPGYSTPITASCQVSDQPMNDVQLTHGSRCRALHTVQRVDDINEQRSCFTESELHDFMVESARDFHVNLSSSIDVSIRLNLLKHCSGDFYRRAKSLEMQLKTLDAEFSQAVQKVQAQRVHNEKLDRAVIAHISKKCPFSKFFFDEFYQKALTAVQSSLTTCHYCHELHTAPKQLPCGDVVCEYCVIADRFGPDVTCPVCCENFKKNFSDFENADPITRYLAEEGSDVEDFIPRNQSFTPCLLCNKTVKDPRQLPCGDIFCLDCLRNVTNSDGWCRLVCPVDGCGREQVFITDQLRISPVTEYRHLRSCQLDDMPTEPGLVLHQNYQRATGYANSHVSATYGKKEIHTVYDLLEYPRKQLNVMGYAYLNFYLAVNHRFDTSESLDTPGEQQKFLKRLSSFVLNAFCNGWEEVYKYVDTITRSEGIGGLFERKKPTKKEFYSLLNRQLQHFSRQPVTSGLPAIFKNSDCQAKALLLLEEMKRLLRSGGQHQKEQEMVDLEYIENNLLKTKEDLKLALVTKMESWLASASTIQQREIIAVDADHQASEEPVCMLHYRESDHRVQVQKLFMLDPIEFDLSTGVDVSTDEEEDEQPQAHAVQSLYSFPIDPDNQEVVKVFFPEEGQLVAFLKERGEAGIRASTFKLANFSHVCKLSRRSNWALNSFLVQRGNITLVDVDESTRFMALYASDSHLVSLYLFEEGWSAWNYHGEINVQDRRYDGGLVLKQILFVPNQRLLCLLDQRNRCHFYDVQKNLMKDWTIDVNAPAEVAAATPDGAFLFVFGTRFKDMQLGSLWFSKERPAASEDAISSDGEDTRANTPDANCVITMDVYSMDSHAHIDQLKLDDKLFPPSSLPSLRLVEFGKHTHLVALNSRLRSLVSHTLLTKSKNKTSQLHEQGSDRRAARDRRQANYLDYLYTVYDKFPEEDRLGPGARSLHFTCVWNVSDDDLRQQITAGNQSSGNICYNYLNDLFNCQKRQTEKLMDEARIPVDVITLDDCRRSPVGNKLNEQLLGDWIQRLISLKPT